MHLISMSGRSTIGCNGKSVTGVLILRVPMLLTALIASAQAPTHRSVLAAAEVGSPGWRLAGWIVPSGLLVIVTLASLISYLLHKQKQLSRARSEQTRLSGMLINAQEEERKRLASELHDDFSQRLALLSLGIENVTELIPPGCEQANQQLHELLNSASELGADLHSVSHRLHSSTLEKLGLVPGVGALCKEFVVQKQIQVTFAHRDVPPSVSTDVALCLFRVVQEALRNVKKHSGASQANVSLSKVNGYLHLAISDNGTGFDLKDLDGKQGIGLLSMEQRARLIDARFAIWSEPQKGTRIDVWAPYQAQTEAETAFSGTSHRSRSVVVGSRS
jgi:signal transduction histidine kinase